MAEHRAFLACKDKQLLLVPYYVFLLGALFLHVTSQCAHRGSKIVSPHIFVSALQSLPGLWVLRGRAGQAKSCSTHCRGAATSVVVSGSSSAEGRPGTAQPSEEEDVLWREAREAGSNYAN